MLKFLSCLVSTNFGSSLGIPILLQIYAKLSSLIPKSITPDRMIFSIVNFCYCDVYQCLCLCSGSGWHVNTVCCRN